MARGRVIGSTTLQGLTLGFALALVATWRILATPGPVVFGDVVFNIFAGPFTPTTWDVIHSTNILTFLPQTLLYLWFAPLYNLVGMMVAERMLLAGTFVALGATTYWTFIAWARHMGRDGRDVRFGAVVAAVAYTLNPWVMERVVHFLLLDAAAVAPLLFFLTTQVPSRATWKPVAGSALLASLVWLPGAITVHGAAFNALLVVLLGLALLLPWPRRTTTAPRRRALILFLTIFLAVDLALYAFAILPFLGAQPVSQASPATDAVTLTLLSGRAQPQNVVRLTSYWWLPVLLGKLGTPGWLEVLWEAATWLLPVLALAGLWSRRRDPRTTALILPAIMAFLIGLGLNPPLGEVYQWAVLHLPGGALVRDPDKMGYLLALPLALWGGWGFVALLGRLPARPTLPHPALRRYATMAVVGVLLFSAFPLTLGDFGGLARPLPLPPDYAELEAWLEVHDGGHRVLWLPQDALPGWAKGTDVPPLVFWASGRRTLVTYPLPVGDLAQGLLGDWLLARRTDHIGSYLALLDVKYVILEGDVEPGLLVDLYHDRLMYQRDLKPVYHSGPLQVFEVQEDPTPAFVAGARAMAVGGLDSLAFIGEALGLDPRSVALEFLEDPERGDTAGSFLLFHDRTLQDLAFSLLGPPYLQAPWTNSPDDQGWGMYTMSNPSWRSFSLRTLDGGHKWDLDLGFPIIVTPVDFRDVRGMTFTGDLVTGASGTYLLALRAFESPLGGNLSVQVDGASSVALNTRGPATVGFHWFPLSNFTWGAGPHHLVIRNVDGFNALNTFALVPLDTWQETERQAQDLAARLPTYYLWDELLKARGAGLDLNITGALGGKATAVEGSLAFGGINQGEGSGVQIRMYAAAAGEAIQGTLDGLPWTISPPKAGWQWLPTPVGLGPGEVHAFVWNATSVADKVFQDDFEGGNLDGWVLDNSNFSVAVASGVEGSPGRSLVLETTRSWNWSAFHTDLPTLPGTAYRFSIAMATKDAQAAYVSLRERWESSDGWVENIQCPGYRPTSSEWTNFTCTFVTGSRTTDLQLRLNAGWSANGSTAFTYFDNISLVRLPSAFVDAVLVGPPLPSPGAFAPGQRITDIQRPASGEMRVSVEGGGLSYLIFAEGYDPSWTADGVRPSRAYGAWNLFPLEGDGTRTVTLAYGPDAWLLLGEVISVAGAAVAVAGVLLTLPGVRDTLMNLPILGARRNRRPR